MAENQRRRPTARGREKIANIGESISAPVPVAVPVPCLLSPVAGLLSHASLVSAMLSHRQRAAWYHQLAQQLDAGLPFAEAVRASAGTGVPSAGLEAIAGKI